MNPLVAVCVLLMACATSVSAIKCHQTTSDSEYSEKDCTDGSCAKVVLDNDAQVRFCSPQTQEDGCKDGISMQLTDFGELGDIPNLFKGLPEVGIPTKTVCYCKSNLCNSALALKVNNMQFVLMIAAALFATVQMVRRQ